MRYRKKVIVPLVVAALAGAAYLANASWPAHVPGARPELLAHRGVHQTFDCADIESDTCTAACMTPPAHGYLENTIASMRAAFDDGADVVELDVQPTTDGELAVFHDWTLECRTNGTGATRERSMDYLKTLDIGYGYTADHGRTYPFRGRGVGLMPTLVEVLDAFPARRFLIHMKSRDPAEGDRVAAALRARPAAQQRLLMVYGDRRPTERVLALVPGMRGFTRESIMACLRPYALVGWTGWVPRACRGTVMAIPRNYARWLWGWPHRFIARMRAADTEVFAASANTVEGVRSLGVDFAGGVWTDHIEVIGAAVKGGS